MSSPSLEDSFVPVVAAKAAQSFEPMLDEGFEPSSVGMSGTRLSTYADEYNFGKVEMRRYRLSSPAVIVARGILKKETLITEDSLHRNLWSSLAFWIAPEAVFRGKTFNINGSTLIELTEESSGKVTYISPPDSDIHGKKFSDKKSYSVELIHNSLTGGKKFVFKPMKNLKMTSEESRNVLKRVAESI